MNRFQYDNVDERITAKDRELALKPKGINTRLYIRDGKEFRGKSTGRRKSDKSK